MEGKLGEVGVMEGELGGVEGVGEEEKTEREAEMERERT